MAKWKWRFMLYFAGILCLVAIRYLDIGPSNLMAGILLGSHDSYQRSRASETDGQKWL